MRPSEFIEALKQQHPIRSVRLADLPATEVAELQVRGIDPAQMIDSQQGRDHFQSLANELFPKLSPELRTLFTNGNIAVGTIGFFSNMSIASETDTKQGWIDFQKFKLLLNYCRDHMPEPARSLFLRELGFPEYCS